MKILHVPYNIAGHSVSLSVAEKVIGLDSNSVSIILDAKGNKFQYNADIEYDFSSYSELKKLFGLSKLFLKYRTGYDVYHFNFGSSFFHFQKLKVPLLDLPFYDSNAIRVMTYQGCDLRQKYPMMKTNQDSDFTACFKESCYNGRCNSGVLDKWRKKTVDKVVKYCDHIFYLNPDLGYFLPKEKSSFLPYVISGLDKVKIKAKLEFCKKNIVHIMHAPSDQGAKGTKYILDVVSRIQDKFGKKVKFTLVENKPHKEALKLYRTCDIFIDQIGSGWYGGVAVEVMKMGIPVMAYINEQDLEFIPNDMAKEIPIINIDPYNLQSKLEDIINNQDSLSEQSEKVLSYVHKWHDAIKIAEYTKKSYYKYLNTKNENS